MCSGKEDYSKLKIPVKNQEHVNSINTKPQIRTIDNGFEDIGNNQWQDTETRKIYNSKGNLLTKSSNETIFETIKEYFENIYYTSELQININRDKSRRRAKFYFLKTGEFIPVYPEHYNTRQNKTEKQNRNLFVTHLLNSLVLILGKKCN